MKSMNNKKRGDWGENEVVHNEGGGAMLMS